MFALTQAFKSDGTSLVRALDRSQSIVEFQPDGIILSTNANFCAVFGVDRSEIIGRHHSVLLEPAYASSSEYQAFWTRVSLGGFDVGQYKCIGKGGGEVWLQASYNPICNSHGAVKKIVLVGTDITHEKLRVSEFEGKFSAISRVQGVIEFTVNGEIITANEHFLTTVGYSLAEIVGRHHRIFVGQSYAQSTDYADFWAKLNRGEFIAGDFNRIGKGGAEVCIQASYNPIFSEDGRIIKIVKLAMDARARISAVNVLRTGLAKLAANNLAHQIEEPLDSTYEQLRTDFNAAVLSMHDLVAGIAASTQTIQSGTGEIARSASDLSKRTEQQAASLEETAAALDHITSTVKRTAEGAAQARDAVAHAKAVAERSEGVVRQATTAMGEIERSSQKIGQIISVIDEIAFQTNLLALNAGVEAARAGDAGRGFAVVASEVRALAQRSAEAAKEIKGLIMTSAQQVGIGVKLVDETGRALTRIAGQVGDINQVVAEIAGSAQEQAAGLGEVNTAIDHMDQVTQQNAAMVEQTTALGHGLAEDARRLSEVVAQFNISTAADNIRKLVPSKRIDAHGPVTSLKYVGRGGAARRSISAAMPAAQDWEEF